MHYHTPKGPQPPPCSGFDGVGGQLCQGVLGLLLVEVEEAVSEVDDVMRRPQLNTRPRSRRQNNRPRLANRMINVGLSNDLKKYDQNSL